MQNIEIMPRYSTIYCVKTNIPFGNLAFFRLVIWQSFVRWFGTNSFGHLKPPDCSLLLLTIYYAPNSA